MKKQFFAYLSAALVAALPMCAIATPAATPPKSSSLFPFVLPWNDASKTFVDVSSLNPAPLTGAQRLSVKNGHFYDQNGRRVRFLGVDFTFTANFPDKADADKVAARMHKLGINCVRLHHMDTRRAPNGIISNQYPDTQHLDPEQLDRLDYLISALKKNGIYVDLNLHVGRTFNAADGLPDVKEQPHYSKGMLWYEPRMIELQKEYAKAFLDHVNPYTGIRYADDPVIAVIELVNEDTLFNLRGAENSYPQVYVKDLQQQWNAFLQKKYGSTEKLITAWNKGTEPLGENIWTNPYPTDGDSKWTVEERDKNQPALLEVTDQPALHVRTGMESTFFIKREIDSLKEGHFYTLQFHAKTSSPCQMSVSYRLNEGTYRFLTGPNSYQLKNGEQEYRFVFYVPQLLQQRTRIEFRFDQFKGDAWISGMSLRPGSQVKIEPDQSLENKSIQLNPVNYKGKCDYIEFLSGLERQFSQTMRDYIKNDLRAKASITCTQVTYGGIAGAWRESSSDYVDAHAYWQHPKFPHKAWDSKDWLITNSPMMLNIQDSTFKRIAPYRISDKPFTISEYNHPNPNDYSAEMMPMLASYAAWQDWDGFFIFQYRGSNKTFNSDHIDGFFNIDNQPVKIGFFPAVARILLANSSEHAVSPTKVLLLPEQQVPQLQANLNTMPTLWNSVGLSNDGYVKDPLQVRFAPVDKPQLKTIPPSGNASINLHWDVNSAATAGLYNAFAPQWNAIVNYNTNPAPIQSGDLTITPLDKTRPFGAYTLISMDNKPVNTSGKLLLTAGGFVESQGMGWNADHTSVGDQWGHGPVMAEGLEATITLKTNAHHVTVYALDTTGKEKMEVPSKLTNGDLTFAIGPKYATIWYAIEQ